MGVILLHAIVMSFDINQSYVLLHIQLSSKWNNKIIITNEYIHMCKLPEVALEILKLPHNIYAWIYLSTVPRMVFR